VGRGHLSEERWVRVGARAWAALGIALLTVGGLWLLGQATPVLTPFILALVMIIVLRRPVAWLDARSVPRWLAVVGCYLASAVILTLVGLFVVPAVAREVSAFAQEFPRYYDSLYRLWTLLETDYATAQWPGWVGELLLASRETIVSWATRISGSTAMFVVSAGGRVFGFLTHLFLALGLAFFVLRDLPTLTRELMGLAGPGKRADLLRLASEVVNVLEGFLRGQIIIATIVGVITGGGLAVLGVPYAAVIGLIAGVTNLVPYVGPWVGGAIAAVSAAFVGPGLMGWTILWVFIVQQTESLALQPRIMSQQVRIHPALVIAALTVGATFFGIAGMLLAVPVVAVLTVVFVHYYERSSGHTVRSTDGALFPALSTKVDDDDVSEEPAEAGEVSV